MQTHDAVEFCQAMMAGTASRRSEEGRGLRGTGSARPASPHVWRSLSAVSDGPLAPVAERDAAKTNHAAGRDATEMNPAPASSPFEKQSRVSWER